MAVSHSFLAGCAWVGCTAGLWSGIVLYVFLLFLAFTVFHF